MYTLSTCARIFLMAVSAASSYVWADEPPAFTQYSPSSSSHPGPFAHTDGATLYRAVCQGCHMPDAGGAIGAGEYPALAGNPRLANPTFPAIMVLNGSGAMPAFADMLTDAQVAAVVNYVRTHFGNDYKDRLTTSDVQRIRVPGGSATK